VPGGDDEVEKMGGPDPAPNATTETDLGGFKPKWLERHPHVEDDTAQNHYELLVCL
jgi:hypothetical protein